jgi:hypothetical protein
VEFWEKLCFGLLQLGFWGIGEFFEIYGILKERPFLRVFKEILGNFWKKQFFEKKVTGSFLKSDNCTPAS